MHPDAVTVQLQAVQAVTDPALARLSLDVLLRELLRRIREVLSADTAVILLPAQDGQVLVVRAALGLEEEVAEQVRVPIGQGIAGRIAAEREPLIVDDLSRVEVVSRYLRERIVSLMGVPLLVEDELVGVMHVGSQAPRAFGVDELHLLRLVADRVALAIANAQHLAAERAARREAEAAIQVRDELVSLATHDLRAALGSVSLRVQLIDLRLEQDDALDATWLRAQIHALRAASTRMVRMVEEMTDVAHLKMGQELDLQQEALDLCTLVRTVTQDQSTEAGAPMLAVDAPTEAVLVYGDAARLERVLRNLIGNAIKYSPPGGSVEVQVQQNERWAVLAVRDHGVGIPADELPRIFTRYFRASTAAGIPGTGIGLAGSKAVVEQHGGQISIESTLGQGTTVTVRLPRADPAAAAPAARLNRATAPA